MHASRRKLLKQIVCAALTAAAAAAARAAASLRIKIISPNPPGGSVDYWIRTLSAGFAERHGIVAVPQTIAGAGGVLAANQMAQMHEPETLHLLAAGLAIFSLLPRLADSGLRGDPNDHYQPLAILWEEPLFIAVKSDARWEKSSEFIAQARNAPGSLSMGTTGTQSSSGWFLNHVREFGEIHLLQVPFKGMTEIVSALLGGHVMAGMLSYQQAKPHVESGKLRLLATTGLRRSLLQPSVPTLIEQKVAEVPLLPWFGLFARRDAAADQVERAVTALNDLLNSNALRQQMHAQGYGFLGLTGSAAEDYLTASNQAWRRILQKRSSNA